MEHGSSSRKRVLEFLLGQEEAVTRPDIAAGCEVSRPTVFSAIQHLEQAGLVHETGQRRAHPAGLRPSSRWHLVPAPCSRSTSAEATSGWPWLTYADASSRSSGRERDRVARPSWPRRTTSPARRSPQPAPTPRH